jgi:predicted DNA binding CopG/RHH family protein
VLAHVDRDAAALTDGVARVEHEVRDGLVDLGRLDLDEGIAVRAAHDVNAARDRGHHELEARGDALGQAHARLGRPSLATEVHEVLRDRADVCERVERVDEQLPVCAERLGADAAEARDRHGEQVVQVVRDARREQAHDLHTLEVLHVSLERASLLEQAVALLQRAHAIHRRADEHAQGDERVELRLARHDHALVAERAGAEGTAHRAADEDGHVHDRAVAVPRDGLFVRARIGARVLDDHGPHRDRELLEHRVCAKRDRREAGRDLGHRPRGREDADHLRRLGIERRDPRRAIARALHDEPLDCLRQRGRGRRQLKLARVPQHLFEIHPHVRQHDSGSTKRPRRPGTGPIRQRRQWLAGRRSEAGQAAHLDRVLARAVARDLEEACRGIALRRDDRAVARHHERGRCALGEVDLARCRDRVLAAEAHLEHAAPGVEAEASRPSRP